MKKKLNFSFLFALVIASLMSCSSTKQGFQSSPVIARNVKLDPIYADINVDEGKKLKGESSSTYFLVFRVSGDNEFAEGIKYSTDANATPLEMANPLKLFSAGRLDKVRGAAAHKALTSGDKSYDVLIHPTYTTKVENYIFVKKYLVTVEGYGANYSNFRTQRQKMVILQDGKEIILQDRD